MPAEKSISVQTPALKKTVSLIQKVIGVFKKRKKLLILLCVILVVLVAYNSFTASKNKPVGTKAKSISTQVDRSFEFPAIATNGKATGNKVKLKIASVEKTDQVIVKDQVYTAKNNKMFLIINLEMKNDTTSAQNLLPGDLVRLTVANNEDNKFAPDLHNNLVPIAAISTKTDRIGFVVPSSATEFKLYVGEIEGKKETVAVNFPS